MTDPITKPVPGFYLIGKGAKVPARIHRPCRCSVNGGTEGQEHDWQDTCDRFPPLIVEIEGHVREDGHDPVGTAWATAEPLIGKGGLTPAQEYAFLCAKQDHRRHYGATDLNQVKPLF